jgi:glucose-1-phosphate cytidylyltransferase
MKVVILAGGLGTRLAEETLVRPKPMVEIGGEPILVHIMRWYADHGFNDFLVACGYRGEMIRDFFNRSDAAPWPTTAVDTGADTPTGGRILRLRELIGSSPFMVSYGDGLGNVDITSLVAFHRSHGRVATVTAVRPPARFGRLTLDGARVSEFVEKAQLAEGWVNGGFFVFEPSVFSYLRDDRPLEHEPLRTLAADGELMAFRHEGFWQPMDTLREKQLLENLWQSGHAPWTIPRRASGPVAASS